MSTLSRLQSGAGKENTSRIINFEQQAPAYAASIAIATTKARTIVKVGQLTGALSLTIGVGTGTADTNAPFADDEVEFNFAADATIRVVTFSTGFQSAGTASVAASKFGTVVFKFNGTAWIEKSRALTA
jgi:hypothetical protein